MDDNNVYLVVVVINDKYEDTSVWCTPSDACKELSKVTEKEIKSANQLAINLVLSGTPYYGSKIVFKEIGSSL